MAILHERDARGAQDILDARGAGREQQAVDFGRMLKLLAHFTSDWPGERVDQAGLAHILNSGGSRPPLVWCFNARDEFPKLAAVLGPDQPVIGLRSLNLVCRFERGRPAQDDRIADHYADLLLETLDPGRCAVGGNCQGSPVASRIAAKLLLQGRAVEPLINMEWQSVLPFPGRCGLIFGERSTMFNPFLRGEAPHARWRAQFAEPVVEIVPGGHGEYFSDAHHVALGQAIARILEGDGLRARSADTLSMVVDVVDPPSVLAASSQADLTISIRSSFQTPPPRERRILLNYLWLSPDYGPSSSRGMKELTDVSARIAVLEIKTPDMPGRWDLYVFPSLDPGGPVSWAANYTSKGCIFIVG